MKVMKGVGMMVLLAFSSLAFADDAVEPTEGQEAAVVQVSVEGAQLVKVNTGNEMTDALANMAARCTERTAAFKACDSAGGFKAMACRKVAEVRYKDVKEAECPNL